MLHVTCPFCHRQMPVAENWSGVVVCAQCNRQMAVKGPVATAPSPVPAPQQLASSAAPTGIQSHTPSSRHRRRRNDGMLIALLAGTGIVFLGILLVAVIVANSSDSNSDDSEGDQEFVDELDYGESTVIANEGVDDRRSGRTGTESKGSRRNKKKAPGDAAAEDGSVDRGVIDSDITDELARHGQAGVQPPAPRDRTLPPDPVTTPSPAVVEAEPTAPPRITAETASETLDKAMTVWSTNGTYSDYVATASHIAIIDLPEWKKNQYELESYSIESAEDFQSDTERRIWVVMKFRDQGVGSTRRLISMTLDENGRWIIRPAADGGS